MAKSSLIGALRVALSLDSAQFETGIAGVERRVNGFGKAMALGMGVAATAAAAAAVGIGAAIKRSIDHADEMGKAAQKFGVAVDEFSRIKYAADLSDISLEGLGKGLQALSRNMVKTAGSGIGPAADAFRALGIQVVDASGKLKSNSAVMIEVAGKFGPMADGAGKTALAMAIFGKSGSDLIPMLNAGAEGMRDTMAEADALGVTISEKTSKAAEAFNDNLTRMDTALGGVSIQLAAALAPAMVGLSDALVDGIKGLQGMSRAAAVLSATFKALMTGVVIVGAAVKQILSDVGGLAKAFGQVAMGNFGGAWATIRDTYQRDVTNFRDAVGAIKGLWKETGADVEASAPAVAEQLAAPIIQGAARARKAAEELMDFRFGALLPQENLLLGARKEIKLRFDVDIPHLEDELSALRFDEVIRLPRERLAEDFRFAMVDGVMSAFDGQLDGFLRSALQGIAASGFSKAFESVSGKLADAFSKVKIPGLGGLGGGLIGGIIGIGAGLLGSLFGGGKKKKAAQEAARKEAADRAQAEADAAAARALEVSNERRGLEIALLRAQGREQEALNLEREDARAAVAEENRDLYDSLIEAQDAATAAAKAQDELAAAQDRAAEAAELAAQAAEDARAATLRGYETAEGMVADARDALADGYEREASALRDVADRHRTYAAELRAFAKTLDPQAATPAAMAAEFRRLFAQTLVGGKLAEAAFGKLPGAGSDFIAATEKNATSVIDIRRAQTQVRIATLRAAEAAEGTASIAEQQLDRLDASVAGLLDINASVQGTNSLIGSLIQAMGLRDGARAAAFDPFWGAFENMDVNKQLAAATGYGGAFGQGGFQSFITAASPDLQAAARAVLLAEGQGGRIQGFATGGGFTVGGAGGMDSQLRALRLSPQERVSISREDPALAMRALVAEVKGLRVEQRLANGVIARNTRRAAEPLQRWDGDGIPEERQVA